MHIYNTNKQTIKCNNTCQSAPTFLRIPWMSLQMFFIDFVFYSSVCFCICAVVCALCCRASERAMISIRWYQRTPLTAIQAGDHLLRSLAQIQIISDTNTNCPPHKYRITCENTNTVRHKYKLPYWQIQDHSQKYKKCQTQIKISLLTNTVSLAQIQIMSDTNTNLNISQGMICLLYQR